MAKPPSLESIVNSAKAFPSKLVDAVRTAPVGGAMLLGYGALLASAATIGKQLTSYLTSVFEPQSLGLTVAVTVETAVFSAIGAILMARAISAVRNQIRVRRELENMLDIHGLDMEHIKGGYFKYWCHRQDFTLACRRRGLLGEYHEAFQHYKGSGKPVEYGWLPNF